MLTDQTFDPESNRRVLLDHAFIVAGGWITKQARNWLGNTLDATKRSQIMFKDRDEILNPPCSQKPRATAGRTPGRYHGSVGTAV